MCFEPHVFSNNLSIQGKYSTIGEFLCVSQILSSATELEEKGTAEGTIYYHFTEDGAPVPSSRTEEENKPEEPP